MEESNIYSWIQSEGEGKEDLCDYSSVNTWGGSSADQKGIDLQAICSNYQKSAWIRQQLIG